MGTDTMVLNKKFQKIHKIGDAYVGLAGDVVNFQPFLDFIKAEGEGKDVDYPKLTDDFTALLIEDGQAMIYQSEGGPIHVDCPAAIGSGSPYALGAMAHGATAKEAVEIACMYDPFSHPPIRTRTIKK